MQNTQEIRANKEENATVCRCDSIRGAFLNQCLNPGTDRRDNIWKFGYALRGMIPVSHQFLSRGRRTNDIAALSLTGGVVGAKMINTAVKGKTL